MHNSLCSSYCLCKAEQQQNEAAAYLPGCKLRQGGFAAIKLVRISSVGIAICILPDGLIRPSSGDTPYRTVPACQVQRTCLRKCSAVSRTLGPPATIEIQDRISPCCSMVGIDEILDPVHHLGGGEAIAVADFEVKHTGKSNSIVRPASAILEKVVGLSSAGA